MPETQNQGIVPTPPETVHIYSQDPIGTVKTPSTVNTGPDTKAVVKGSLSPVPQIIANRAKIETRLKTIPAKDSTAEVDRLELKGAMDSSIKNPLLYTSQRQFLAGSLRRVQDIISNPKYQALKPFEQKTVLARYYDETIKPGYKKWDLPAPDVKTYADKIDSPNFQFSPADYYGGMARTSALWKASAGALDAGAKTYTGMVHSGIWLKEQVAYDMLGLSQFFKHPTEKFVSFDSHDSQEIKAKEADIHARAQRQKEIVDRASNDLIHDSIFYNDLHPSKNISDHIGSFVGEMIAQLPLYSGLGKARGAITGAEDLTNLTKALNLNKVGVFVAKRFGTAVDGYLSSAFQGQDEKQRLETMASFVAGDMVLGPMGGLAAKLTIASVASTRKFITHLLSMGGRPLVQSLRNEAQHELENELVNGATAKTREEVIEALKKAHAEDPIKNSLMIADKVATNSASMALFKKPWRMLSKTQRMLVNRHLNEITEDAIQGAPLVLQDEAKANIEAKHQEILSKSKPYQDLTEFLKSDGIDPVTEAQTAEQKALKKQLGIESSQKAIQRARIKKDPVNTPEQIDKSERRYASFKTDSLAYFKSMQGSNPPSSAKNFDYKAWFEDMGVHDLGSEIQYHLGQIGVKFENTEHALIWALNYLKDLPRPFASKIYDELAELRPKDESIDNWFEYARNLNAHLYQLAATGHLETEGHIFKSTHVENWLTPTKWQEMLRAEHEKIELDNFAKAFAKFSPEAVEHALITIKQLQEFRITAEIPERYIEASDTIKLYIKTRGNPLGDIAYSRKNVLHKEETDPAFTPGRRFEDETRSKSLVSMYAELKSFYEEQDRLRNLYNNTKDYVKQQKYAHDWDIINTQYDALRTKFEKVKTQPILNTNIGQVRKHSGGDVVMYLNREAIDYFRTAVGDAAEKGTLHGYSIDIPRLENEYLRLYINGLTLNPNTAEKDLNDKLINLTKTALTNASERGVVVVSLDKKGVKFAVNTLRHEIGHNAQRAWGKGDIYKHLSPPVLRMLNARLPVAIQDYLAPHYDAQPAIRVAEAAVNIISGNFADMKVDKTEALVWLNHYFNSVEAKHGKNALKEIHYAHAAIRKLIKERQ